MDTDNEQLRIPSRVKSFFYLCLDYTDSIHSSLHVSLPPPQLLSPCKSIFYMTFTATALGKNTFLEEDLHSGQITQNQGLQSIREENHLEPLYKFKWAMKTIIAGKCSSPALDKKMQK